MLLLLKNNNLYDTLGFRNSNFSKKNLIYLTMIIYHYRFKNSPVKLKSIFAI